MIIKYPNKILTSISTNVTLKEGRRIADLLRAEIASLPKGTAAGLAAPQIGINANVFSASDIIYINPVITNYSFVKYKTKEACLSLEKDKLYEVERSEAITVKYTNYKGKEKTAMFQGYHAQVFQHEYDHLLGKLINL